MTDGMDGGGKRGKGRRNDCDVNIYQYLRPYYFPYDAPPNPVIVAVRFLVPGHDSE